MSSTLLVLSRQSPESLIHSRVSKLQKMRICAGIWISNFGSFFAVGGESCSGLCRFQSVLGSWQRLISSKFPLGRILQEGGGLYALFRMLYGQYLVLSKYLLNEWINPMNFLRVYKKISFHLRFSGNCEKAWRPWWWLVWEAMLADQHYLMGSATGFIKNTVTIVQVLRSNQLHTFNTLLSLVHFTFLFFLLLGQRTKRVKFSR